MVIVEPANRCFVVKYTEAANIAALYDKVVDLAANSCCGNKVEASDSCYDSRSIK